MKCRRTNALVPAALSAAVLLVHALPGNPARAAAAASSSINTQTFDYSLSTSSDIPVPDPNATTPQVIASLPAGTIVPPKQSDGTQGSPLTILNSSTGFDQNQLVVALKDNVSNGSGSSQQLFGLSFFGSGLKAAGHLDFALNVDKSLSAAPVLQSQTPGVTIKSLEMAAPPPSTVLNPTAGTPQTQVPEPISLILWSALTGVGFWRWRKRA